MRINLGLLAPPSEPLTIPENCRDEIAVHGVPLPTDEVVFFWSPRLKIPPSLTR